MATLSAQVETTLNERSADRLTSNLESITSRAEQFTPTMTGGESISDQLSERVSTGLTEGLEESMDAFGGLRDALGAGVGRGAEMAAGAVGGEEEETATGGLLDTVKSNPALATLGAIAGSTAVLARASPTFGAIFDLLDTAVKLYLQPIGRIIGSQILPFAKKGVQMAQTFNEIANGGSLSVVLPDLIEQGITSTKNGISWLRDNIGMTIWKALPSPIQSALTGAWNFIKGVGNLAVQIGQRIKSFVGDPIGTLQSTFNSVTNWLTTKGTQFVSYFIDGTLQTEIEEALSIIPGVGGNLKEKAAEVGTATAGGAVAGGAAGSVVPGLGTGVGAAIGGTAGLIRGLTGLASGGVVTGATPAMVGEGSESEAVLPLSNLENMLSVDREISVETEVNLNDSEISNQLDELIRIGRKLLDQDPVEIDRSRYDASRR